MDHQAVTAISVYLEMPQIPQELLDQIEQCPVPTATAPAPAPAPVTQQPQQQPLDIDLFDGAVPAPVTTTQQQQQPFDIGFFDCGIPATVTQEQQQQQQPSSSNLQCQSLIVERATGGRIKIDGNLLEMTWGWAPRELQDRRRLVKFWCSGYCEEEGGPTIEFKFHATDPLEFQALRTRQTITSAVVLAVAAEKAHQQCQATPGHIPPKPGESSTSICSSPVVSCIYWYAQDDYFITSVDCILLLEGLLNTRFTVEEKNRIRRNLEGFRPYTISKCKPDCADFFKLIMGFPYPKPRNIEKDVKVFPWKILPQAIRKIIRKYTPSLL